MTRGADPPPDADALAEGEVVYRRVPEMHAINSGWIKGDRIDAAAFTPNQADAGGLSLTRAASAAAAAAGGRRGKRYLVVPLRVQDIRARGINLTADAENHALIPGWTYQQRKSDEVRTGAAYLASICGPVEGPFDGQWEPPPPAAANPP